MTPTPAWYEADADDSDRNVTDDITASTPQEPRGATLPAVEPARGFSDADLLRRRTAALNRTQESRDKWKAEAERLRGQVERARQSARRAEQGKSLAEDVEPLERLMGHVRAVLAQAHDAQDVSETHHRNCYQTRGVPDDLPQDLCDCRILWMIDGHAFGERTQRITEWGIQLPGGNVLQINTVPIAEEVRDSQIKAMAAAGKVGDLVSRVRVHTEDDVSEWEAKR